MVRDKNRISAAIQVTITLSRENEARELEGLCQAMEKCRVASGTLITYAQRRTIKRDGRRIAVVPITDWLLSV